MSDGWTNNSNTWTNPEPADPYAKMSNDELLMHWQKVKNAITEAQALEMEVRKAIVKREFPNPKEGMNNKDLGDKGFVLKAGIKYNYKLASNDEVEKGLDAIAKIGNQGSFIADRLVSWSPNFLLTEYRVLQEEAAKGDKSAQAILDEVTKFLTISEATPTLEIKEPKAKKGK